MNCIFCDIINKKSPAHIIYEDARVLAFIDIFPKTRGHLLVIPKVHARNIFDISEEDLHAVASVAKKMALVVKEKLSATGVSIFQLNEKSGQQTVFHYHVHVMPRYDDQQNIEFAQDYTPEEGELEELSQTLSCW